jgi:hypothetical protein
MISGVAAAQGDLPLDKQQQVAQLCRLFEDRVREEVSAQKLMPIAFPALFPCQILCVVDAAQVHVVFSNTNVGGVPLQLWRSLPNETLTPQQVEAAAVAEMGFQNSQAFHVTVHALKAPPELQRNLMNRLAQEYVNRTVKELSKPKAIEVYRDLQPLLDRFTSDHPDWEKNVFIAMRFTDAAHFAAVHQAIKDGLAVYGLKGVRADDRVYPTDDDLWNNVCVYMMGCKYGICVFDDFDTRDFNPNVSIEYGFMRATGNRVLLLKEQRLKALPTDITGKLYRPFDMMDPARTIGKQISLWAERDLSLSPMVSDTPKI